MQASNATQEVTVQTRLAVALRTNHTSTGVSSLEAKVRMSCLQAEHGRNVLSTLAEGRTVCRRDPDHAEHWKFSCAGSAAGSCGDIHSSWVEKSYIPRIQRPNIEVLRGAGIVRHGLLDLYAN